MSQQEILDNVLAGNWPTETVPDLRLVPEQRIADVAHPSITLPDRHPSVVKTMMRLAMAPSPSEIGVHGPVNAAVASEANADSPEMNLYNKLYPRDAHVAARFLRSRYPLLTKATIIATLEFTGVREHLRSLQRQQDEQEVGKPAHEATYKQAPTGLPYGLDKNRAYPYFGAIDTPAKNINAITWYALHGEADPKDLLDFTTYEGLDGKDHTVAEGLADHLNWIRKRMDLNPEGVVESLWINKKHHANQSWADSPDAFHHADGTLAEHHPEKNWGVSSVEVQSEIFEALASAEELYRKLLPSTTGERKAYLEAEITDLALRKDRLKAVILDKYWVEDPEHFGGYFARGADRDADGNFRQLAVRSADMGLLLVSGVLDEDNPEVVRKREATIRNLFSPEMLGPNGIRSLSTDSVRYHDKVYHNGNVWLWQNRMIAEGLADRYGYYGLVYELNKRTWDFYDQTKTLGEYGTGSSDPSDRINMELQVHIFDPSIYPEPIYHFSLYKIIQPPQEIQAWTAAATMAIKYENGLRIFRPQLAPPLHAGDSDKRAFEDEILGNIAA